MKLLVIIPNYNDERHLYTLIDRIKAKVDIKILVIDDGSKKEPSLDKSIYYLRNEMNKGKGYSLNKAFMFADKLGYTHAITMDADLQHSPDNVEAFLNQDSAIDLVLGYRSFKSPMPLMRIASNYITTKFIQFSSGCNKVLDSQCGFRRYNLKKVKSFDCREMGFHYESEILIKMISLDKTTVENVKVDTIYGDESSSISSFRDTMKFIALIIRSFFWKMA